MDLDSNIDAPGCFYKTGVDYAFTYNPEDKYQHFGHVDRFKKCRSHFYELLLPLSQNCITYEMVIELSEPNEGRHGYGGPRYHIHGVIRFKHRKGIYWFLEQYLYRISRTGLWKIVPIVDLVDWYSYMKKQSDIFGKRNVRFSSSEDIKDLIDVFSESASEGNF